MNDGSRKDLRQKIPLTLTPNDHLFKNGDLSGVWGNAMEVDAARTAFHGVYWKGMRHLSRLRLEVSGMEPLPITPLTDGGNGDSPFSFSITRLGPSLTPEMDEKNAGPPIVDGPLLVHHNRFCTPNGLEEEIRIDNHGMFEITLPVSLQIDADFRDIMDIRGIRSHWPVHTVEKTILKKDNALLLSCSCEDRIRRESCVVVHEPGLSPSPEGFSGHLRIPAYGHASFRISTVFQDTGRSFPPPSLLLADTIARREDQDRRKDKAFRSRWARIEGEGFPFERWRDNALRDLRILLSPQPSGPFPYAGIPWFSTPFGRDALITGFFTLWAYPDLSKSILAFLARHQAKKRDSFRDSEPGKILHEFRLGEAAHDPSVPFSSYYGSVDATPLFVALSAAYLEKTGDRRFLSRIGPAIDRAMGWIEKFGIDPASGFLVYSGDTDGGLIQKGWKDSGDSVFHDDGQIAPHPIALAEVQGYLYMAYRGYAAILAARGDRAGSTTYARKARDLKKLFNELFWSHSIGMFSLAIDGKGRPCQVRSSNAGHLLFTGIAERNLARITAKELMQEDMFSGFGIRTIGSDEPRYNPVSYHNGSIWPHDNAIILEGFSRYGFSKEASLLARGYFSALSAFPGERAPELYCGFSRNKEDSAPLPYPTSCRIQAWSVSSIFMVFHAMGTLSERKRKAAGEETGPPSPGTKKRTILHIPHDILYSVRRTTDHR
ncbi:MAG: glycogen debranching N-terminal domain-containing protein [Leptospirillia bacterium]